LALFAKLYDFRDFVPEHFHLARDKRNGLLGFFAASGCFFICPADLAQYESPLEVPGLMVAPFCPYLTVFSRPVSGLVTFLENFFSMIIFSLLFSWNLGKP
jgi:hypothetical protein